MYPQMQDPIEIIDLFQRSKNMLEYYITNREVVIKQREHEIAKLKLKCEQLERRADLLKQFGQIFFEQRAQVRNVSMTALDIAIDKGDVDIAKIALTMLGNEYGKDFFGMMNKI